MKSKAMFAITSCLFGSAFMVSQAVAQQPALERPTVAPDIAGVVAAGTKVERVWTGLQSADGLIAEPNGTLLLPEQAASRVSRVNKDGKITPYLEDTNGAGGIAIDSKGRVIAVERTKPEVRVLVPQRKVLVDTFEGKPLDGASDIVADKDRKSVV